MKSAKKLMALLLAVVMVCSMLPMTAMADFAKVNSWETEVYTDVSSGDWFYENVKTAYELGLMIGHDDSTFAPEGHLTMAQTIAIAARLHSIAATGSESFEQGSPWYKVYADYALAQGIISSEPDNWAREATRIEFARIMVKALPAEDLAPINDVAYGDIPDVADDEAVYTLYRAGILRGNDDTLRFEPESSIRRSEVAAIVTRMADPSLRIHAEPEQPEETPSQPEQPSQPGGGIVIKPVPKPEGETASGDVTADENGKSAEEVTLTGETVKATVPAGVALEDGADSLTLTVSPVKESESNIQLGKDESMASYDVHIDGVAEDNTVAIIVELGAVLPMGLNWGNISLYHVENGETVPMTRVETLSELDEHNEFFYDPATGCVTVALASFSEITSLYNTENKWNGNRDYTWYDASKSTLTIANADQLAGLSAIVGGMDGRTQDSFSDKTVKLIANIYIGDTDSENGIVFYPIGYYNSDGTYAKTNTAITSGFKPFMGTFDGNGHTIANFYQNTWEMKGDHDWYDATLQYYRDGMGLFGKVYGGTVKNLTVENFSSDGEIATTGVIAAYADCGALFENISIFNCNPRVYNIGNGGIVGCVGWYANDAHTTPVTFRNITVDNTNKISALWGSWDVPCGGLVGQYYPTSGQENAIDNAGIYMENCHVAAQIDVNNDVCANYQYYAYRYAGILIGSVRENVEQDGHIYPKMDGITAKNCTVHFGDWNDYYYCELVANSLASYTHDHQMSRLEQVASVDVENMKYLPLGAEDVAENWVAIPSGRVNYVVVKNKDANGMWIHGDGADYATCYHFVDGKVWNHADGGYEEKDIDGDGVVDSDVLKEDKQLVYREFNNLVTGYGWGVTSKAVGDMAGVLILDKVAENEGNSIKKFEANTSLENGSFIAGQLGDLEVGVLFSAIEGTSPEIHTETIMVSVSPADANSNVVGTFTPNATDWTKGTLNISGSGNAIITITDYYYCLPTTLTVNFAEVSSLVVVPQKNAYDISKGETFSISDIAVAAVYSNGGTGILTSNDYTLTKTPNPTTFGAHTGTVSYTYADKTVTADFTVYGVNTATANNTLAGNIGLHFDYFSVQTGVNTGFAASGTGYAEYNNGVSATYATSNNLAGGNTAGQVTINNAQLANPIALSGWVGYGVDFNQFGYYVNGAVSSLCVVEKFADGESPVNTSEYAGQYAKRFFFHDIDLNTLGLHDGENTITFVSVHSNGIQELTTWTVYWNCTADTNISAKTANVIILAGQSNAYGVSPYTDAVNAAVADTNFSNIRIRYANFGNPSGDIEVATWQTISKTGHDRFDVFAPGIGGPNTALFGPELAIAEYLATNYPDEVWYIIKFAAAGSLLNGDWYDGTVDRTVTLDGESVFLANAMNAFIRESMTAITATHGNNVNIRAFMWMQGESEASDWSGSWATGYAELEQTLINDIRSNYESYSTSGIKFVDAGIAAYKEGTNNWYHANNGTVSVTINGETATQTVTNGINDQKKDNCATHWDPDAGTPTTTNNNPGITNSIYFDTSTLTTKADDPAHYDGDSMFKLGTWFAEAMFK